jgi:DNA-binding FrmR family transcriptional regulator
MIHSSPALKKKLLLAIKKSQGTLENITKMIEADESCADVGQQFSSAIGLLRSASIDLMKNHLICCGTTALSHKNPKKSHEFVEEFARIWDVSTRK